MRCIVQVITWVFSSVNKYPDYKVARCLIQANVPNIILSVIWLIPVIQKHTLL